MSLQLLPLVVLALTGCSKRNSAKGLGEDLFAFGSNRNLTLGFNDQDDRQYPERVFIKRPDHLYVRFHNEFLEQAGVGSSAGHDLSKIPTLILNRPLVIKDVVLSKLHSAVLTTDPVSNLYVCGVGRGGRLGLGDENTRFTYTPVQGPLADRHITQVALGQNHSMAIDNTGALWTWGNNANGQLGYALPEPPKKDEDPISTSPRQLFGPLKKEFILGIAASSIHSVAHTGTSLFCWGKNVGQLALMDADSRSCEFQQTPRKVAASLFSSPIVMVSAIDKATTILLQNHTVCVFLGYGYNVIKSFGDFDLFGNPSYHDINHIASGGETIAALTRRGDTMSLDLRVVNNHPASSTTNPSKPKGAVTAPQCIWRAKKDGVRSVGISEHGSIIMGTESGAVWQRVKRTKAKDAYSAASDTKRKDFKFQRVPYITRVSAVRASHGAFAAVRQDSDVLKEQPVIDEPSLRQDVADMSPLNGFRASTSKIKSETAYWKGEGVKNRLARLSPVACEVLKSSRLEEDLAEHLTSWRYSHDPLDISVCTSSEPEIQVPVHGWLLSARSPVLRNGLALYRETGSHEHPDAFKISEVDGKAVVVFQGLDLLSLLNLVCYMYSDEAIPMWDFAREAQAMAYRCRQVRVEVMRMAGCLKMPSLEAAARLHAPPRKCIETDFQAAIKDERFFEDADAIIDLDDDEVEIHSSFICQRCPWFKGLFHGRSGGSWLAGRRQALDSSSGAPEKIRIDLSDMDPEAFQYVLRYLYGDYGLELFDSTVCDTFEDFLDLVMEVMSIANYLMLDRLSQICQKIMGKFANIHSVAHLLNAISPCSITEFKDAGLEYVCLQLESILENHLLDELDEDLLLELDEVVRANQAAQLPFAKSGRAEMLLHENNPLLAQDIDEERQTRVREMAYKAQKEEEKKPSLPLRTRFGSLDDATPATPSPDRIKRVPKAARNEPFSPNLTPRKSQADLMFDMDEEDGSADMSPLSRPRKGKEIASELDQIPPLNSPWKSVDRTGTDEHDLGTPGQSLKVGKGIATSVSPGGHSPLQMRGDSPWGSSKISTTKLDLGDIIKAESTTHSALTAGLAAQKDKEPAPKLALPKLSQKEKKRQQQQQAAQAALHAVEATTPKKAWEKSPAGDSPASSPWKLATAKTKPSSSTNQFLSADNSPAPAAPTPKPDATAPLHRRTASPDTRFAGQRSTPSIRPPARPVPIPTAAEPAKPPLVPHSKTYITPAPKAEQMLGGYALADIIGQQKRDKQSVKEAAAKRSLQEIQQEQAFQEWWDAESRRTQEEEAAREAAVAAGGGRKTTMAPGARRGRSGGKVARGGGQGPASVGGDGGEEGGGRKAARGGRPRGRGRGGSHATAPAPKGSGNGGGGGRQQ